MSKKVEIKQIGLDENNYVILEGVKNSDLSQQDYHLLINPPLENEHDQLYSIIKGSPNLYNSFIKTILNTTGEKVESVGMFDNSKYHLQKLNLKKSGEITPILTEIGLIYALIDGADISSDTSLTLESLLKKELPLADDKQDFNDWLETINFKSIDALSETEPLNELDIQKKNYNKLTFKGPGNLSYLQLTQIPVPIQLNQEASQTQNSIIPIPLLKETTKKILVYLGENSYVFTAPEEGVINEKIMKTSRKKEMSLKEKTNYDYWLNRFNYHKYGCLGITKEILNRTGYKPKGVYLEADFLEILKGDSNNQAALLKPLDSAITLEKNGKKTTFKIPGDLAVGFGYLYNPCSVYLDEKNLEVKGRKIDKSPYEGMYV